MKVTVDPHYPLWRPEDRSQITLAQIGNLPPGRRYGLRKLELEQDDRGAHMAAKAKSWSGGKKGRPMRFWAPEDDAALLQYRRDLVPWADIAAKMGRTCCACETRMKVLNRRRTA